MTQYELHRDELLTRSYTSFWLRNAIKALDNRDPVDAVNDAEVLVGLARQRADEMLDRAGFDKATALSPVKVVKCLQPDAAAREAGL